MTSESLDSITTIPALPARVVPGRRHSIAVGQSSSKAENSSGRRKSIQESLHSLTQSMSMGLRLALRSSRDSLYLGDNTILNKNILKGVMASHFDDPDLRVSKMLCHKSEEEGGAEIHSLEVWMKTEGARRRVDLVVTIESQESLEIKVYNTLITHLRNYLLAKFIQPRVYLCVADHFLLVPPAPPPPLQEQEQEQEQATPAAAPTATTSAPLSPAEEEHRLSETFNNKVLILDNLKLKGYRAEGEMESSGMDYEHSVLAVARLAKFHAVSYCYRLENNVDYLSEYPWLSLKPIQAVSTQTILRLETIFQQNSQFRQLAPIFLESIKNESRATVDRNINIFGVLSHGNLTRKHALFKYKSELESRLFCSDMLLQDLSSVCYSSCAVDLLCLLFTAVHPDVREDYMADLVCSVYYDSFASTVAAIANRVPVFSKSDFVKEFEQKIMFGFLLALNHYTQEYETNLVEQEGKERTLNSSPHPSYTFTQYRDSVLAIARDVFQFKLNTKATI